MTEIDVLQKIAHILVSIQWSLALLALNTGIRCLQEGFRK